MIRESRYLTELRTITYDRHELDNQEHIAIDNARAAGATWGQIAVALGMSAPQGARQRFERLSRRLNARVPA